MKTQLILTTATLAFAALSATAQTHSHGAHGQAPAQVAQAATPAPATTPTAAPMKDMTEAEVRKVDKEAKKVTLKHGPIKNLDMPGMTMVFQVRDDKLFDKIVAGEKIKFTAEQLQGAFVVTSVEKVETK